MSYRDDALDRLDFRSFLERQSVVLGAKVGPDEWRFLCPFHDDHEASANANLTKGVWFCHVCDRGGSAIDFLMGKGLDYKDALTEIGSLAGMDPPSVTKRPVTNGAEAAPKPRRRSGGPLSEEKVEAWFEAGQRAEWLQRWFTETRGYTADTIKRWQLGWDGDRVTLPIRDEAGALINVRRRRDPRQAGDSPAGKVIGYAGNNEARLWPLPLPENTDVVLVEGEWDAMLMHQEGFGNTVTVTSGAGIWKPEFTPLFKDRRVTIAYDNDDAGRRGMAKIAPILATVAAEVRILQIPNLPQKGDITDFFVEQNRTADELRSLIDDASPYVVATTIAPDDTEPVPLPLFRASDARFRGQRLQLPVLLSGKAMTPYTVPSEFTVRCDMSNRRFCAICPMQAVSGVRDVKLSASDPAVLSLIGVSTTSQYEAIKELAKAVKQCNRPQVEIHASTNIEELRLIPELDASASADGDTEYVSRTGYFLGHGLLPNRGYQMVGYSHPAPKTQATVHLLSEAIPAQDNISAFSMDPELAARLRTFQTTDVAERFRDIYDDFRLTVHRIQDRFDMQVAFDLIWHSVIAFTFNGSFVRRGWAEGMLLSDSGQGKTEMAMALLEHYGLGERIQSEQTSMAGLLGGLEKIGDTWMLGWGRIPLNDKRLLVVDEAQGLRPEAVEALSDVRATGIAEITKIRTERTNARCRIAWLANPVSGLTLAQHNQGVLAIKELFKKPEDIRRLDFAIAMSSGDVDYARAINVRHGVAGEPRYGSDLCRSLVLWAWSRRADQIEFTTEATDAILLAATDMGRRYHASIPLVEPADQRLKLARLAAAAAARVFSTNEDGERVIVRPEHVAFVVDFLERVYGSRAMAYDEYSEAMAKGESLTDEDAQEVFDEIRSWTNSEDAISYLRTALIFKKSDLSDGLDWADGYTRERIKFLQGRRLIRTTRTGYVKTPALIDLLRKLANGEDRLPSQDEAPF